MKGPIVTIRLTQAQARIIWQIIDGAQDAGSCEGGLTDAEHAACTRLVDQILSKLTKEGAK